MERIVSVVVPTKNRYKYLKTLIDLIESYQNEEIELVVQDNSDNNEEILEFLKGKNLISTVYYYCSDKLSMSQNADLGVRNSIGKFVCFIGDDDAVCRTIADCAHWMQKNNIDALQSLYIQYNWNEKADGTSNGMLSYDSGVSFNYKELNPIKELVKVLKRGAQGFMNMPKLYQGVVSRRVIDKLFEWGGTCFPGVTPDMSSAVSLCFFVDKYITIDIPVVLPGRSKMVAGGVMGKVLSLEEVSFISDQNRKAWEEGFPKLWATELIWPDCAMKALRYVKHEEYIQKYFNKNMMLSQLVVIHRRYLKEALKFADNKLLFLFDFIKYLIVVGVSHFWRKVILLKLTGKTDGKYAEKWGFKDIISAESYLGTLIPNFDFNKLNK